LKRRLDLKGKAWQAISWPIVAVLILVAVLSGIVFSPTAKAINLPLTVSNVDFSISDYGVITNSIAWNFLGQTHILFKSFLAIAHDDYPLGGGATDVATGFGGPSGDFIVDEPNVYIQSDTIQETYASFTQTGVKGVANDLKIYQRAIAKQNEDWTVLVWKLENIYGQDIYDLRVGMNFHTKIHSTHGDDLDHWNAGDSTYYIEDTTTGADFMGLASADPTVPLNRYYGNPSGIGGEVVGSDDQSLYNALTTNKVHGGATDMTCMVGWEVGTLPAGSNVTLPLVIAFGTRYQDISWAVSQARNFLILRMTKLVVSEVQDFASMDNVKIEIYNDGERSVSASEMYLSPDGLTTWNAGGWTVDPVAPGQHTVYSLGPGEAFSSLEGGKVGLHYSSGAVLDSVSFGQAGPAPDPLRDESTARYWNGVNYSNEWVRDPTPTFGAQNDCDGLLDPPSVVLHEVYFNANSPEERFIELYYPGSSSVYTQGWSLVVDSEYGLPAFFLSTTNRYFILRGEDIPVDFDMDDGTTNGDNVYLYDVFGRLVDEVGWSSAHVKGQSMVRVINPAQWGYDGYNDASSMSAGWTFGRTPTPGIMSLEPDQSEMVDVGETAEYDIYLSYHASGTDIFDMTYVSSLGWVTTLTDINYDPLVDNDGDSIPDSGVMSTGNVLNLKVSVTAPLDPKTGNINTVYVTATSSVNTDVQDMVTLSTVAVVPPYIVLNKSADPDTIWIEGSPAFPQETTVTLDVTGMGTPLTWYMPQDAVFIIDNSGSMDWNDPGGLRFSATKSYVDMMKVPDRAATTYFTLNGFLVGGHHLTWNYNQVKNDIDSIPSAGGGTDISTGIRVANDELIAYGDSAHVLVEILLTDGRNSGMTDPITVQEAQRAADNGIIIFTIGLLIGGDVNEALLQQIADITGGEYHPAPTPEALEDIYLGIFQKVMNIAGRRIDDPAEPNPMIRDVIPPHISYIPNSFRDKNLNPLPPDVITPNPDGSVALDWNVDKIFINESWIVRYDVTSSMDGYVPVGVYPFSRVNYTKWDNSTETLLFPDVHVTVLVPQPVNPPILGIDSDQNDVHLAWTIPGENISHYLIYRAPDQRGFDFSNPYKDTSKDSDGGVIWTRTTWNDTGAATLVPREYYYVVRAVNNLGFKSISSNTVGKWTKRFDPGLNTFSLPLEPIVKNDIEWYASSIPSTVYIDWMDSSDHWVRHYKGGPVQKVDPLTIGEGFQIYVTSPTYLAFVGTPASMIKYQEGLGDSLTFRRGLTVQVIQDDVHVFWPPAAGAVEYNIYRADNRMAFHLDSLSPIATVDASTSNWLDVDAVSQASTWYYMVVPVRGDGVEGGSTHSVGVLSISYKPGHTAMGLPLKPMGIWRLDHYCENMGATGMAYLIFGVWKFHATQMPAGVYDPVVEQAVGYQVSVDGVPSRYTYVGY
jgi:hypothetical protein